MLIFYSEGLYSSVGFHIILSTDSVIINSLSNYLPCYSSSSPTNITHSALWSLNIIDTWHRSSR